MSGEFATVVSRVRERVTPTPTERDRLQRVIDTLTARANAAVADLPVDADVLLVGSTARDTWIAGDRDIDLFLSFPTDLDRESLETYGLAVGHAVLPDGHEEYAEHPYVVGEFEGYQVDCVPCYGVDDAADIQSAVDRTPFHTRYLERRLDDVTDDVRVCKQFFKAIGVYGSDLRTRGFSGFLTELLVVEYDGFRPLIEAAADWHPPETFDPEEHGQRSFDDPLVVVDPTDPERNVAAVLSAENVARLQHYARELLAEPRAELFEPTAPTAFTAEDVRDAVTDRATTPIALQFDAPDIVADQLWPQLEKSRAGIAEELDRRGFDVFRTDAFADDERAVLLFELAVAERPRIQRHDGPPVQVREHATDFWDSYADSDVYGPFLAGDRYVVERERPFTTAVSLLDSDELLEMALGAHVQSALQTGYTVDVGPEIAKLASAFGTELAAYFEPFP